MDIVELHERALDETARLVDGISPDQLALPTPCSEWDVRTLLNHLVGGNRRFAALGQGAGGPPTRGAGPQDLLGDDPAAAYRTSAEALKEAWRQPGVLDGMYELPFGKMPGTAALQLHTVETVTHGWDLGKAIGHPPKYDPDVVEAADSFTRRSLEGARPPGTPFSDPTEVPEDASTLDRLAAFLGRQV